MDEDLSEVVGVSDVAPESLGLIQELGGVLGSLAALGLGLPEDDVADEVHEADGQEVVPLHGRAERRREIKMKLSDKKQSGNGVSS